MRIDLRRLVALGLANLALAWLPTGSRADFVVKNLVSDIAGLAANTDPNLKNPWGVSYAPTGPFWVSDQANSKSTLYGSSGAPVALVVSIPTTGTGGQGPTGQVFNGNKSDFLLSNGNASTFLFANLNGQISGWNGGSAAQTVVSNTGAVYTGLAIGQLGSDNQLFGADTKNNKIDVYNSSFQNITGSLSSTAFKDPFLPTGYKVFNVQNLGGTIYVTYDNTSGGNAATNGGFVATFDLNGNFLKQLIAGGPGGPVEDPWGLALAPPGFGQFGGALLVGNKESGQINAFDNTTGAFLGLVATVTNDPTSTNNGLWGLTFGNGGAGGDPNTLYAFAGINNEQDGLMVSVSFVPEPGSAILTGLGALCVVGFERRRRASKRA